MILLSCVLGVILLLSQACLRSVMLFLQKKVIFEQRSVFNSNRGKVKEKGAYS